MQNQLTTYLKAGYPGLAVISSEEARAEAEIAAACTSLKRRLHAWSSTEGLVDTKEGRVTTCPDPLDALQLLDGMFAATNPQHVVLLRDLQLHLDQTDPMLVRRLKDTLRVAKANGHAGPATIELRKLLASGRPGPRNSPQSKPWRSHQARQPRAQ
jgi:hypothetical protein